jgi:hypothetical protein
VTDKEKTYQIVAAAMKKYGCQGGQSTPTTTPGRRRRNRSQLTNFVYPETTVS